MEHGVKGITRFRSLLNNKASAVETMETKLDVCIGIYNANMLFKEHLEDTIPRRPDKKGVSSRMINCREGKQEGKEKDGTMRLACHPKGIPHHVNEEKETDLRLQTGRQSAGESVGEYPSA